jgi:hypothetical protein
MSIVLQSSGGGSVTINEPTTASNFTQTLPAATGDVMVSGNMPAFAAYLAANQSISNGGSTKVLFDTEIFDTNNNFASSRFTPTVAGYYQINLTIGMGGTSMILGYGEIRKNGALHAGLSYGTPYNSANCFGSVSQIIYFNGSTDYVEGYALAYATSPIAFGGGPQYSQFSGCLVRSA